ncbi:unnamed protein product [Cylicostephanus goldi]|uniref:Uncharacterized protein n=1 Tax=Cylicostephanus goldi TaxID=71465 RepID=A0A3P6R364_CYLGO|nr:unnamed protein product [Cylicostephanus goldi]
MSGDLAVDPTVNTEGSEKKEPKAKKTGKEQKERRVTSKKRGFLKKGEDILDVSVHAKAGRIRRGPNALEDSDNRFVWCSALLKIPCRVGSLFDDDAPRWH